MGKFIDLTGQKFGLWTVIKRSKTVKNNQIYWDCRCDCGVERPVNGISLRSGSSTNCGCVRKNKLSDQHLNLIGQKYNDLLVLEYDKATSKQKCQCSCGAIVYVASNNLISGHTKSCYKCGMATGALKRSSDLTGQRFGQLLVLERSPSSNSKWICQCDCGVIKEIHRSSLQQGNSQSCGHVKSRGEQKIIQLLSENTILYEYQKQFDTCQFSDTKKKARFDFYVDNSYIIEYDGIQHFTCSNNSWYTQETFQKLQQRDKEKNEWCKSNGVPLIRIPYNILDSLCIEDLLLETSKYRVN